MTHFAQNELDSSNSDSRDSSTNDSNLESTMLNKITAKASKTQTSNQIYQSDAGNISREAIESNPSGNGDITSLLRILPNVQYDNAQLKSTTPGEIDPANISISGGLYYQNNFQLDGFNMNNDLFPGGGGDATQTNPVAISALPSRSQGLNVDTSLLESIRVQDSNISAAYGGFTGGVVEANTKRPSKKFGAKISYQITQGDARDDKISMTKYHIYDANKEDFINSTSASNQPTFIKHIVRSSLESKINDNAGVIVSFTTTQSFIPLNAYAASQIDTTLDDKRKTQKRQSYNLFLKGYYDIGENLRLEASYAYMPQFNNYFIVNVRNSSFNLESGGHQAGLKAIWDNAIGLLTSQLQVNYMKNSRSDSATTQKFWRYSTDKNWNPNGGNQGEGGYGNVDTTQTNINLKINQDFKTLHLGFWDNTFNIGAELGYVNAKYERYEDFMQGFLAAGVMQAGQTCTDLEWCSNGVVQMQTGTWAGNNGQYINRASLYKAGKINLDNIVMAAFLEDSMKFALGIVGDVHTRFGVRLDYDTYMSKVTLAPRFSLSYVAPWSKWERGKNFATNLTFGINRYYGRNLFTYGLMDGRSALQYTLSRSSETTSWANATATQYRNTTNFTQLNVPYADEIMGGFAQQILGFILGAKYIHRFGRDEIRKGCFTQNGNITTNCSASSQAASAGMYRYTNDGSSETDVVTISLQNSKPLEVWKVKNFFLFAFDWTNVKRNYTDLSDSLDNDQLQNEWISYNGTLMRYADRPADNYIRPFTIRLTTTQTFDIWRMKWIWNNFFRLRGSYTAMANTDVANQDSFIIDGVQTSVPTFRPFSVKNAFTWDMRLGFEMNVYKGNTLFVNLDIYNLLNAQNISIMNFSGSVGAASFSATPVYEIGRQFWLEVGYKF